MYMYIHNKKTMKKDIYFGDFLNDFITGMYKNNFTYDGLRALFNYLEDYEESTGEVYDYDVVAIACEFSEYKNLKELQKNYKEIESMQQLENNTMVIPIENSDGFIIVDY